MFCKMCVRYDTVKYITLMGVFEITRAGDAKAGL